MWEEDRDKFEKAVSCIASLAYLWVANGVFFAFDSGEFHAEVHGEGDSYDDLMEYLACVSPCEEERLDLARLPRDSILFLAGSDRCGVGVRTVDYLRF